MKTKIITLIMILSALFAVASLAQEIDPGTGVKIGTLPGGAVPIWSPDGKWFVTGGDGIYLTPVEGGDAVKIYTSVPYNQESPDYGASNLCYSPDKQEIYFDTYFHDKNRGTIVEGFNVYNLIPVIMAFNITAKAVRVVREEARCAQFSSDGRYFGYINYDHRAVTDPANAEHHYAIAIFDTVTKETKYIGENLGEQVSSYSFSSDNTYVAAPIYGPDRKSQLFRIPLDESPAEEIISLDNPWGLVLFSNPRYSPDGRWIMFEGSDRIRLDSLFMYNTETKETKPFFPIGEVTNTRGIWSPDGKKICCNLQVSNKGEFYTFDFIEKNIGIEPVLTKVAQYIPKDFGMELAKIDLSLVDKTDLELYTELDYLKYGQQDAIWSPDGKWIAVSSSTPIPYQNGISVNAIWIIPSGGGTPIKVCDLSNSLEYKGQFLYADASLTAFTPNSQEILYETDIIDESRATTNSTRIKAMKAVNIFTGETRLVMDAAMLGIYSHNGRYFAYINSYLYGDFKLMLYDSETQQTRKLADKGSTTTLSHFSDDDSYIIAVISNTWKKISLDGEIIEDLGVYKRGSFSPDERFILFTSADGNRERLSLYDTVTKKTEYITPKNSLLQAYDGVDGAPSFSPDGKKFCYVLESDGLISGQAVALWYHVYVLDINLAKYAVVTGVETDKPLEFALQGNYPNPFNPSITIQFSLAKAGKVNLAIYNVAGQKIREIVKNTELTPGIHHVLWDGHDDFGKPVSSGVYLSRLQMGGKVVAGRMLLMK